MVDICERLIHEADLANNQTGGMIHGCTLYSDNYYTSVKMAKHLYKKYWWTLVGTVVPTEKTSRSDEDLPFVKLSNGARNKLRRGWFCEAYMMKNLSMSMKAYYMQCTTWKDKKQVMFLATNQVGFSQGLTVQRHMKRKKSVKPSNNPKPMHIMLDQWVALIGMTEIAMITQRVSTLTCGTFGSFAASEVASCPLPP